MTGWPVTTIVRGQIVVRDGVLTGKPGQGEHIARERSSRAVPAGRLPSGFEPAGRFA